MIRIKILNESKQLLNEVSYDEAVKTLQGDKFNRRLFNLAQTKKDVFYSETPIRVGDYDNPESIIKFLKGLILDCTPRDISDKERGLSLLWLKNQIVDNIEQFQNYKIHDISRYLERFFQWNLDIKPDKKDLNRVSNLDELFALVDDAEPRHDAREQEKAKKESVKELAKIEIIYDGPEWQIAIPWNKSAAIIVARDILPSEAKKLVSAGKQQELLKQTKCTTDWCTAGIGINYFDNYHSDSSPLFVFVNKSDIQERYQFSYSSDQFMDKNDSPIGNNSKLFNELHYLLSNISGIKEKFPIIKKFNIRKMGNKYVYIEDNNYHKGIYIDGVLKKIIMQDGTQEWYKKQGTLHRLKAPSVLKPDGSEEWYMDGLLHREDGPAITDKKSGNKAWALEGKYINPDPSYKYGGPSVLNSDGKKTWYLDNYKFNTENNFNEVIDKLKKDKGQGGELVRRYLNLLEKYRKQSHSLKENKKFVIRIVRNK